ncbi:MAG TPA: hypothetical protein VJ650_05340 [Gemmatimonadaceae bacterium]|nr:hypothetical protein [Gemmatimonadaceae bacterium]
MLRAVPVALFLAPAALPAQETAAAAPMLTSEQQITVAVLPLPADLRAGATVLGYDATGKLTPLRKGTGEMTCLAPNRATSRFHVACYHNSLEPFMARGRALRASGVTGDAVDSARFREVKTGKLAVPRNPASLYSLTGDWSTLDASTLTANGARRLFVVYIPFATTETTGLSDKPARGTPWIMGAGTPKAHIMFVPEM